MSLSERLKLGLALGLCSVAAILICRAICVAVRVFVQPLLGL